MDSGKTYYEWSNLDKQWIALYFTWSDVFLAIKVSESLGGGGGGGSLLRQPRTIKQPNPQQIIKKSLTDKEYKKFINLVCRVNGITVLQLKERKPDRKISLIEITKTIDEVLKPQVRVTQIGNKDI